MKATGTRGLTSSGTVQVQELVYKPQKSDRLWKNDESFNESFDFGIDLGNIQSLPYHKMTKILTSLPSSFVLTCSI